MAEFDLMKNDGDADIKQPVNTQIAAIFFSQLFWHTLKFIKLFFVIRWRTIQTKNGKSMSDKNRLRFGVKPYSIITKWKRKLIHFSVAYRKMFIEVMRSCFCCQLSSLLAARMLATHMHIKLGSTYVCLCVCACICDIRICKMNIVNTLDCKELLIMANMSISHAKMQVNNLDMAYTHI